jgi:hypothetical protein
MLFPLRQRIHRPAFPEKFISLSSAVENLWRGKLVNPLNLGKLFTRVVPRRPHRIAILGATALGVALLVALPLSLGSGSPTPGAPASLALANVAGAETNDATHAAASPAESAPPSPAAPASKAATVAPKPTKVQTVKVAPPSAKELNFDFESQINGYYCGPAATRIAASARISPPSQDSIANAMGTTTNGTNSAADTTQELNALEGTGFYHTTFIPGSDATSAEADQLQANVVHAISSGYGIVANIVGSAQDTSGNYHEYDGGHYISIIGYTDDGRDVRIADPAVSEDQGLYTMSTIDLANWMGTRGYSS